MSKITISPELTDVKLKKNLKEESKPKEKRTETRETPDTYLRIGIRYFKKVLKPLASGDKSETLIPWSKDCIKQDFGKGFLARIPRYNGLCLIPSHVNFRQVIDNFYNRYHPLKYKPLPGYPGLILAFLNHIFGEQLDIGLDYLKILYLEPTQILPILCLVSTERITGKTTFLNLAKAIFGDNMTINTNTDFRSNFNSEWADKTIIGVDETFLEKKEDSEKIKNLSTSRYHKIEAKGQDRYEIQFFGKFILCSNNENNFIQIDQSEVRYWIRRLPSLEHDDKDLLQKMVKEIPFLLHYLLERPYSTKPTTRMWFHPSQLITPALRKIKSYNRNQIETEIAQILLSILDEEEKADELRFCIGDVQDWLRTKGFRKASSNGIRKILQENWKLKPSGNSNSYIQYRLANDGSLYSNMRKGRYYNLSKCEILNLNNLDDFDDKSISS